VTDELRPGDKIELRGPIGGYFGIIAISGTMPDPPATSHERPAVGRLPDVPDWEARGL
jgi:hypothetical protein